MAKEQDVFRLPIRIGEFDIEDLTIAVRQNFREIERNLGLLQSILKTVTGGALADFIAKAQLWNQSVTDAIDALDLASAAEEAARLINDAIGGNILIRQGSGTTNEILIMDHADPELAEKVWRWNMGGLGYSDNVIGVDNPERIYETAMTMDGTINANFIKTGLLGADYIQIGAATTFEPGYDPTKIVAGSSANMHVDADCAGLWHFDGNLNSHKGVSIIADDIFEPGYFGQAVLPGEGAFDISTGKAEGMSSSSQYSAVYGPENLVDGNIVMGSGSAFATLWGAEFPQWHQIDLGDTYLINKVKWINNNQIARLPRDYTIAVSATGAFNGEQTIVVTKTGNASIEWVEHDFPPISGRYVRMTVSSVAEGLYYELTEWQIFGLCPCALKIPTNDLITNQGTISFRANNLEDAESESVLIDLPSSVGAQGMLVGINEDDKLYVADSKEVLASFTEDFISGTLDGVVQGLNGLSLGQFPVLSFDGINDYVDLGNNLNTTTQMTIELVLNSDTDAVEPEQAMIANGLGVGGNQYYIRHRTDGDFEVRINGHEKQLRFLTDGLTAGVYIHIASVFDKTNNFFAVYKNGVELDSGPLTETPIRPTVNNITYLGMDNRSVSFFKGKIKYVRIWDTARTQQQIQTNANKELTGSEQGLVGYWKCDEGTGTTLHDSTSNGHDGTIHGASWVVGGYQAEGSYTSSVIDLSSAESAESSQIVWSATEPAGTEVEVATALSTNGGTTWGDWQTATSGQAIPGITSATDLSNARLKIKVIFTTNDVSKTPLLTSLAMSITGGSAIALGPEKTDLTAWDMYSLAWNEDRLSLTINNDEACYIENPALPASFSPYLHIGADRNGLNAIGALIDELRIDRVYRDIDTRIGWYKAEVPFYTSEDMKQWPGYMKLETDGIKLYDADNVLRVLLGSWIKDAIRKYGIKIIDGEIYSSYFKSGKEDDTGFYVEIGQTQNRGFMNLIGMSEKKSLRLHTSDEQGVITWYCPGDEQVATIFPNGTLSREMQFRSETGLVLSSQTGERIILGPNQDITNARGIQLTPINSDLNPYGDDAWDVGTTAKRWYRVRAHYVTQGDLCFEEKSCPMCGASFIPGDVLSLLAHHIEDTTYTIPIHARCKDLRAEFEIEVPECETKYRLNELGEAEAYLDTAFEEVEKEIIVIHPDYAFNEKTGKFLRKENEENAQYFDSEDLKTGIAASREVALATDTVLQRKPKYKSITVRVNSDQKMKGE